MPCARWIAIGGLDPFLLKSKDSVLSVKALRLKRAIAKKTAKLGGLSNPTQDLP